MRRAIFFVLFLGPLLTTPAFAAGFLVPRDGSAPIAVKSHRVAVEIDDGLAKTTLRQTFVNPRGGALEAVYQFPVPEGAALVDVAIETAGQRLEGLLVERKRARRVYDDIVRGRRDPALVEQVGRNTFRLSVFPVLPKVDTVVEISWIERLPLSQGLLHYRYPLFLVGKTAETQGDFTFSAKFRSSVPIETITSPVEDMDIVRQGPGQAALSFERMKAPLDRDVEIVAEIALSKPTLTVSTFRREGEADGWFTAVVTPPKATEAELLPRDVILIVDTSGSMNGVKIEQARRASIYLLSHLRPGDRINIVRFSTTLRPFAEEPVPATLESVAKLTDFVNDFRPGGGTAPGDALKYGVNVPEAEGRVRTVVFLTDGLPTVGITSPEKIIEFAREGGKKGLRIYTFGVGTDVDPSLLTAISRVSRGRAEIFGPEAELEYRLRAFLDRTASPVLADIEFKADDLKIYDIFPRPIPDGYLGEQVILTGRYQGGGERAVTAAATLGGKRAELTAAVDFCREAGGSKAVLWLAGREHLDFLEQALRLRNGLDDESYYRTVDTGGYSTKDEIVEEMIRVSLTHGVQCAYTSFLALLPGDRARLDPTAWGEIREALDRLRRETGATSLPAPQGGEVGALDELLRARFGDMSAREEMDDGGGSGGPASSGSDGGGGSDSGRGASRGKGALGGSFPGRGGNAGAQSTPATPAGPAGPSADPAKAAPLAPPPPPPDGEDPVEEAEPEPASGWVVPEFYSHRYARKGLKEEGGTKATEKAVLDALDWLANHQDPNGRWAAEGFTAQCKLNQCGGPGNKLYDVGTTGLALLAFLGAGQTPFVGTHKERVLKATTWLMSKQSEQGYFGTVISGTSVYNHAIATRAIVEAYGLTGSPFLLDSATRAVKYIHMLQNPYLAWRYGLRPGDNDTSVSAWMLLALKSAKAAGLRVDQAGFDGMKTWLDKVTEPEYGRVGYTSRGTGPCRPQDLMDRFPADKSESLTAAAILCRVFLGESPQKSEMIAKGTDLVLKCMPVWDEESGAIDQYYWHFGTLAMMQVGGDAWKSWRTGMFSVAVDSQRKQGDEKGSWDPAGPWGREGGRVYSTAVMTLALESPYLYPRQFPISRRNRGGRHRTR